jgi:hypothetical protein
MDKEKGMAGEPIPEFDMNQPVAKKTQNACLLLTKH